MASMARFNFDNLIEELNPIDFHIQCGVNHRHKLIIVNAYDVDLYQSWTIELESILKNVSNVESIILDIGLSYLHLQRSAIRQVAVQATRIGVKFGVVRGRYLIKYKSKSKSDRTFRAAYDAVNSTWKYFRVNSFSLNATAEDVKSKSIFSTLATTFRTVEFSLRRNILKIFILNLAFELAYSKTIQALRIEKPCVLFVGNGRLVKPAAIVHAARSQGVQVRILERGAFPGTFDIYDVSPHSIDERRKHAKRILERLDRDKARIISEEYIALRKEFDPISGLKWQRNFETGRLPQLEDKKICVCFTSTETEFAVFGDSIQQTLFQNQEEAFRVLASNLDPAEWQVIIRRHPYGSTRSRKDPELKLWDQLGKFPHVKFIEPFSPIDSYALAMKADLVAHFNSSMGPEAISLQAAPVITMGPTLWEQEDSLYLVNSEEKLQNFLLSDFKIRDVSDIHSWALYWSTFGYKFKVVEWSESKGFVNGKRIL